MGIFKASNASSAASSVPNSQKIGISPRSGATQQNAAHSQNQSGANSNGYNYSSGSGSGSSGSGVGGGSRDTALVKLPQVPDKLRSGSTPTDRERYTAHYTKQQILLFKSTNSSLK
jgi:hypothetical protein